MTCILTSLIPSVVAGEEEEADSLEWTIHLEIPSEEEGVVEVRSEEAVEVRSEEAVVASVEEASAVEAVDSSLEFDWIYLYIYTFINYQLIKV